MKKYMIVLALAIPALFLQCAAQKGNTSRKKLDKQIYLQLYSLRDDVAKDLKGTVKEVSNMGFAGIEAANYKDGKIYDMEPVQFRDFMKSNDLTLLSAHIAKPLTENMTKEDWDNTWKWWDEAIAAHKTAGAKYVIVPWMTAPKTLAELKRTCDYFNQIGERCNKAGLKFGYHNHDFEFKQLEGQMIYDYMLTNTDPSKVVFEMDCYWVSHSGNSPVAYFKKYPGRFPLLHIKDEKELGESGMMDFKAIFDNAKTAGLKYVILEQERYSLAPIESTRKSLFYLLKSPFVKARYDK